jgi:hypothetical protein
MLLFVPGAVFYIWGFISTLNDIGDAIVLERRNLASRSGFAPTLEFPSKGGFRLGAAAWHRF